MRLTGAMYDEIEKAACDFLMRMELAFPVNPFDLCKQMGIKVERYSDASEEQRNVLLSASKDGLQVVLEVSKGVYQTVIYYNDQMPTERIRFTLMHEIAHIILGHQQHSDLAESEANYFARYVLAPPPIIHESHINDFLDLAEMFKLSKECAYNAMRSYFKWLRYGRRKKQEYESALLSRFKPLLP